MVTIGGIVFEMRRVGRRRQLEIRGPIMGMGVDLATETELAALVAALAREHAVWLVETAAALKPDAYAILGISSGASATEVKAAYRKRARQCHPDKHAGDSEKGAAAEKMKAVNEAYAVLMAAGHH